VDEAALLRAVAAAPDDDTPRLVYADWLDDQGRHERAEFIRLQVELARAPDHPRRAELETRQAQLLAAHEQSWAPDSELALFFEWRRGFVAGIHPAARGVFNGDDGLRLLAEFPLAEEVAIGFCMTDAEFRHMPALPNLRSLSLGGNVSLTPDAIGRVARWRTLRRLRLGGIRVTDAALPRLAGLTGLRELDVSWTEVTDGGLPHLAGLTGLEALDLSHTRVTGRGLSALAALPRLRRLNLADTVYFDAGLGGLAGCRALEELRLGSMNLYDDPVAEADLAVLRGLPALRAIDLGDWSEPTDACSGRCRLGLPAVELRSWHRQCRGLRDGCWVAGGVCAACSGAGPRAAPDADR